MEILHPTPQGARGGIHGGGTHGGGTLSDTSAHENNMECSQEETLHVLMVAMSDMCFDVLGQPV